MDEIWNIAGCPKAELHCHLDGVVDPAMVRQLHAEIPDFPLDADTLSCLYPIQGFTAFWAWFKYVEPVESQLAYLCRIVQLHTERLKAQNVRYAELMLPAGGCKLYNRTPEEALERVGALHQAVTATAGEQLTVNFLIGLGRNRAPDQIAGFVPTLLALHAAGLIVGVGVAGIEQGYPIRPFAPTLARLREAGLGIEVHAGEWCGPESIRDALEYGRPHRIGHATTLFQAPKLVALFQEQKLHIEICPSSNLATGSIARIEEHPVARARALGLNFSINTDDPGAFLISMNSEYSLLAERFDFGPTDFERIYQNSLAAAFSQPVRLDVSSAPRKALIAPER